MISQTAEYALRAVLCLADGRGVALTTQHIADAAHIPVGYLAKVMQALCRAGLVSSQRGINGGFALAVEPAQLTLMDVVRVVDPSHRIRTCPLGIASHGRTLCPLHRRLDAAAANAEQILRETNLSELLDADGHMICCGPDAEPEHDHSGADALDPIAPPPERPHD
jgi:Rrf2 family protein